jgi:hypothetical protein
MNLTLDTSIEDKPYKGIHLWFMLKTGTDH